jgi:hypothetical protein
MNIWPKGSSLQVAKRHTGTWLLSLLVVLAAAAAHSEAKITLKNPFITKYMNQATITATFTVDHVGKVKKPSPSKPSNDGDIHCSGRAPEIGLAAVAEVMNAADLGEAAAKLKDAEGTDQPLTIVGAWRVWCEHGGGADQVQGAAVSPAKDTNPDHVFEIHPIATVDGVSTVSGYHSIPGYQTKDAATAFNAYQHTRCQITPGKSQTTITTTNVGYNYVEFVLELNEAPTATKSGDGALAFAKVLDLSGDLIHRNRRMVFVKDSPPYTAVISQKAGTRLHVLGVPRVDMSLVWWRAQNAVKKPEALGWSLPYEIIVVAVYDDLGPAGEPDE